MENKTGISLKPTMDTISTVAAYVEQMMEEYEVNLKQVYKINVAVDEIFSNIARYSGASCAQVLCNISEESISVRFKDNGIPYNPLDKPDPDINLSAEDRQIGGLGIYLTRKLMDQVSYSYEDGYNIVGISVKRE